MDPYIDLCPKCKKEVFQYINEAKQRVYRCVEDDCPWSGAEPIVEKREKYE